MPVRYLLSSAYFPPIDYLSLINKADNILIENEENYLKQTFRNRCIILTANGICALTVPVLSGKLNKTPIKDTRIDYSKRWQQVHLGALISSYKASPFFDYYFDEIEKLISSKPEFLADLNLNSINILMKITGLSANISLTDSFEPATGLKYDFRYSISPKNERPGISSFKEYYQVFNNKYGFVPALSSLDLIFNMGPDSNNYLIV
jgi:hypothetical protein